MVNGCGVGVGKHNYSLGDAYLRLDELLGSSSHYHFLFHIELIISCYFSS